MMISRAGRAWRIEEVISAARCYLTCWSRNQGGVLPRRSGGGAGSADGELRRHSPTRSCALISPGSRRRLQRPLRRTGGAGLRQGQFPRGRRRRSPAVGPRSVQPARPADSPPGRRGRGAAAPVISPPALQAASPHGDQPDHARPAQRDVPPRGADFAVPDQSPLTPARPSGGSGRPGTGPSRGQQAPRRHYRGLRQRPSPFP